jgi:hypothetical protein
MEIALYTRVRFCHSGFCYSLHQWDADDRAALAAALRWPGITVVSLAKRSRRTRIAIARRSICATAASGFVRLVGVTL